MFHSFSRQLIILTDLYHSNEVSDHICPIALTLGADRVAEVRSIAYKLVSLELQDPVSVLTFNVVYLIFHFLS